MKKAIALLLVLAMCLSLCACGGSKAVEKALQGRWEGSSLIYVFKDGKFEDYFSLGNMTLPNRSGTYEIEENEIILYDESGNKTGSLTYSMETNGLVLADGLFKKVG